MTLARIIRSVLLVAAATSYVATHYVAPFASVSGASNDYDDLGATAWANATSSGTPTTLGTACARAVAGNKVRCAPGLYTGERWDLGVEGVSEHRDVGCFQPANNGTNGNPIIFFAQYPAANNYSNSGLLSELTRPNPPEPVTDYASPCFLMLGNDVVIDGFHVDERNTVVGPDSNLIRLGGPTRCEVRRCAVTRDSTPSASYNNGYNANPLGAYNSIDCKFTDCYAFGCATDAHLNHSALEFYGNQNMVVEYCTFENAWYSTFAKDDNTFTQDVTYRYCKFLNCKTGIAHQSNTDGVTITQCLMIVDDVGIYFQSQDGTASPATVTNNTIILNGTGVSPMGPGGLYFGLGAVNYDGSVYRNNLIYIKSGSHAGLTFVQRDGSQTYTSWSDITFNYNHYYDAGGSPTNRWKDEGSSYSTLDAWNDANKDANSTYSDPQFVDAANNDYRLQVGSPALTSGNTGGPVGCYITGSENIGVRANPSYG